MRRFGSSIVGCTDITGFGFMGHLVSLLKTMSSSVSLKEEEGEEKGEGMLFNVQLHFNQFPFFAGVEGLLENSVLATLLEENLRFSCFVKNHDFFMTHYLLYSLLFDPQTSGGLIMVVEEEESQNLLRTLQSEEGGYSYAAIVGSLTESSYHRHKIEITMKE